MTSVARGACRTCAAEILWCKSASGRWIPVDAVPVEDGNVRVTGGVADVLGPLEAHAARKTEALHRAHHSTCPQAAEHRRPRR